MVVQDFRRICDHKLSVEIRSGASVVNVKPVFSYDSQYIIIACRTDLKVLLVKNGATVQTLRHHTSPVISIQANKNNDLQVFSCSDYGTVVRWDYIDGKKLQVFELMVPVIHFFAPYASGPWFMVKQYEDHHRLYSFLPKQEGSKSWQTVIYPVSPEDNSIDFSYVEKFCVGIYRNSVRVHILDTKKNRSHLTGKRNLTCVVCHPSDAIFATGDDQGRVLIWANALHNNSPIRSIYHWHTLPVADIAFTSEGSYLYSVGGEATLVKWNIFAEDKNFLPRLGAPMVYVASSRDNKYVMTAHQDNAIQIIDSQRTVVQVIQGLTKGKRMYKLPTGLLYNSYMRAIVMNGKPGHLQFFDTEQDKQLFNLDIAGKNFLTQERDYSIFNIDVQRAAVDDTGIWLSTAEFWCGSDSSPQIWLKFWMFNVEKQTFVLNTNVILPHNKEIKCVTFRPYPESSTRPLAATTSSDGRFKIWTLNEDPAKKMQNWSCESMGCYRDFPAGSACFSEEGSLLAVAFEGAATLWDVEAVTLKAVLCNNNKNIRQLLFGRDSSSHLLVCQDGSSITVWNVLTLSITWIVHNEVQVLAGDRLSSTMAAFCKGQNLIIFTPDNPEPLRSFQKVSDVPVISCLFEPIGDLIKNMKQDSCFHTHSKLLFINEDQTLFSLSEAKLEEEKCAEKPVQNVIETPYAMLQAERKVTKVKEIVAEELSIPAKLNEKNIIEDPVHQNPLALCSSILPTMLRRLKISKDETKPDIQQQSDETKSDIQQQSEQEKPVAKEINIPCPKLNISDFDFLKSFEFRL